VIVEVPVLDHSLAKGVVAVGRGRTFDAEQSQPVGIVNTRTFVVPSVVPCTRLPLELYADSDLIRPGVPT